MIDLTKVPAAHVLATIPGVDFYSTWTEPEREACREWLRANRLDPDLVATTENVHVVLADCPAISYPMFLRNADGTIRLDRERDVVLTERRTVLLRVPLPDPCPFPVHREETA